MPSNVNSKAEEKRRSFHIRWKSWIPKLEAAFGLYVMTQSFLMTLGIMILIIVAVELIDNVVERNRIGS